MKVAFLGLGTMGYLMAGRLAGAGVELTAYNRSGATARNWAQAHGRPVADTPALAARGACVVIACLSNDAAVRSVTQGKEGAFAAMEPGAIFLDHSTGSATLARELADDASRRGIHFLDAPVSGGKPGAAKGALTVMVGGEEAALESARGTMAHYASSIFHVGPAGAGQVAKMANQVCIGGILQSLAEAMALARCAGLDPRRVLEVLQTGSARSWQMEQRGPLMVEGRYDFGFSARLLGKDLEIGLDEASRSQLELPVTSVTASALRELVEAGFGDADVSALDRRYRSR